MDPVSTERHDAEVGDSHTSANLEDAILQEIRTFTEGFFEPPIVLSRVLQLTNDPEATMDDISQTLGTSASIAARVLKVSNSAYYGFSGQITTIDRAVVLLGRQSVRSIVVASSVNKLYVKPGDVAELYKSQWRHSMATAIFARIVARRGACDPEEAYLAGLLHDLGKLVMLERFRDQFLPIAQDCDSNGQSLVKREREVFGFTHADVTAILVEKWLYPKRLIEPVSNHHRKCDTESLAGVVGLANLFVTVEGHNIHFASEEEKEKIDEFGLYEETIRFHEVLNEQLSLFEEK